MFISNAFSCVDEMNIRRLVETFSLEELSVEKKSRRMGRLGQVVEGDGKSLIFGIRNYVNHRLFGGGGRCSPSENPQKLTKYLIKWWTKCSNPYLKI
ncbi:hypothetical protein YC2023_059656 [Brassica napus]